MKDVKIMGKLPHVLAVPAPAQTHVMPLMNFSHKLADHGIRVTFLITEFIHSKILASLPSKDAEKSNQIHLVSVPDGMEPGDDRRDARKLSNAIMKAMPAHLEDLIRKIRKSNEDEEITCVIADASFWWPLEIAQKMGIKRAAFWQSAVGTLALSLHIPKLKEDGIIDDNGNPSKNEMIQLSATMPAVSTSEFMWVCTADQTRQKAIFRAALGAIQAIKVSNWILCNSFSELEPWASDLIPDILPIGPVLASNQFGVSTGHFLPEDSTCLNWLDQQPLCSVIYIAFGCNRFFNQHQFNELALSLEHVRRPFLWVVRPEFTNLPHTTYPDGFVGRVANRGKVVSWAPQQKVLAHPSVACVVSHCGWNSTLDAISMGVPFLCWPYQVDQFLHKSYICDVWKVGLALNPDENGIISRHEIKSKLDKLLSDKDIKARSLKLKEMAGKTVGRGGTSFNNFEHFVEKMMQ